MTDMKFIAPMSLTRLNEIKYDHLREGRCAGSNKAIRELVSEVDRLSQLLNTPEISDFVKAVQLEAPHQRERWGSDHDAGKTPQDWFWLIGYLAGKALHSISSGKTEKGLHHIITTAAALCNWHAALLGQTNMRPSIATPKVE